MNTNRWMQEVNARFPVRKSKVQKAQFRQYVLQKAQELGYAARVEENKAICTNRNIVVGDVDKAKVLVTAHYDTPATVGLPNVMLPMNRPMFYLVQALIALVMVVFIFVPTGIVKKLTGSIFCTEATLIGLYCLMMYLLLAGVPNPHNVNDNILRQRRFARFSTYALLPCGNGIALATCNTSSLATRTCTLLLLSKPSHTPAP